MDLSKVSTDDLKAFQAGDLSKVSTEGLRTLSAPEAVNPRGAKIDKYLAETDTQLGLPPGTSARQIQQESRFEDHRVSPAGARGLAQVMPKTVESLSARMGRKLDPHNTDDALLMHRELMWENMNRWVNPDDALRAYNAGWDKTKWNNKETNNYIEVISKGATAAPAVVPPVVPPVVPLSAPKAAAADPDAPQGYVPFAKIRKDVDPASLNTDADWVRASKELYRLRERKNWEGTDANVGEWGKEFMGWNESNTAAFALYAKDVVKNGTPDEKRAYIYMMDTAGNLNYSWAGTGRFFKGAITDPMNIASVASLGIGGVAKTLTATAARAGVRKALMTSLGRTGIVAGVDTGIITGATNSISQTVRVDAGAKDSFSATELGASVAVGTALGVVVGTAGDAAVASIINAARRHLPAKARSGPVAPPAAASVPPVAPAAPVTPAAPAATPPVAPGVDPLKAAPVTPDGPELVLKDLLTEAELVAGTKRAQEGRLWVDDLAPVTPANGKGVDVPFTGEGLRSTPRSNAGTLRAGEDVADQLRGLEDTDLHGTLETLRNASYTAEERATVDAGVMLYAKEMLGEQLTLMRGIQESTNAQETLQMVRRLAAVEDRLVPLALANDAMGSAAGSLLQQRRLDPFAFKGMTVESLMAEKGITRGDAESLFLSLHEGAAKDAAVAKVASDYDTKIEAALAGDDHLEAARLQVAKRLEVNAMVEQTLPGSASWMHKITEAAISNVFSMSTIIINVVAPTLKTVVRPLVKALVSDPLQKATRVEMAATYSAMTSTIGASLRKARASYLMEQSLLSRTTGNLMEGELALEGRTAGVIRFLPRILGASDEFLGNVNYNGFVAGDAAAKALIEGTEKGMTGAALKDYIKVSAEIAMKEAYLQKSGEALIQPVVNKGVNLGLKGEALDAFIAKNSAKFSEELRHASNLTALGKSNDVLYKRDFSGKGISSDIAQRYQQATNKHPALKLVLGQLFFRTPVRVFEEGIRLTPGLQLLAPHFIADLSGANGAARQARAQAESVASIAITGAVVALYARGEIVGDGAPDNFKEARLRADGPGQPANSVRMSDGSFWVYRNLDPISTPVKIMLNGLERLDKLAMRQAQGELIDKGLWDQGMAYITVGTMAVAAALRDANLAAGVNNAIKLGENLTDPEGKEDAWLKFFGEKLGWAVPNTFTKLAKQNDPTIKDPADFWQVVESKLAGLRVDRDDIKTSYSYDVLGNVRTIADTGALWSVFSTDTPLEQSRGMSKEAQAVMLEFTRLSKETGTIFAVPLKSDKTGDFDPRTVLTADGQETIFDRWQRNYREMDPVGQLYGIAAADMPDGTRDAKGIKAGLMQSLMNKMRSDAYEITMSDEAAVFDAHMKKTIRDSEGKSGLLDFKIRDK